MDKLTTFFLSKPEIKIVIVYGSFAVGKQTSESDIDIAIAGDRPFSSEELQKLVEELSLIVLRPIDLVDLNVIHAPLSQEVFGKGKILKKTDLYLHVKLVNRMLREVADFLPIKRRVQTAKLKRFFQHGS
jgi:predicted nucleotidyltransferase